jgi:hypothetical protein
VASRQILYRCLIISPGDVSADRVEPVRWETHGTPEMGDRAQAILNKQIVDDCDLGIAVFWSRLGTPTGGHESGSVEEIERLLSKNSRVMVYFSSAPIPQAAVRGEEFHRLQEVRKRYEDRGLLGTYSTLEQLARMCLLHLTTTVGGMLIQDEAPAQPIPATGSVTAPRPDIRLRVTRGHVITPGAKHAPDVLAVRVENHSPSDFYLSSVGMLLENGHGLWQGVDPVTLQRQEPR